MLGNPRLVSSPLTKPVECSTTVTVAAEHAVLLASAKNVKLYSFYLIHLVNYASKHFDVPELIAPLLISESLLVALLTSEFQPVF